MFDHGYNDRWRYDDKFLEIPENPYDKNHFIGAMNFLIKLIYEDNPRARIALIGHYENDRSEKVSEAQKIIAEYWDIPLIRTWELMGWSQKVINGKTLTQHWMPDDLHPHSDESGQALQLYTDVLTPYINNLR